MRITPVALIALVAACGGGSSKKVVKPPPPPPPPAVVEEPPPPPPPPLSIEERVAFQASCYADFVAEVPESFGRCYTEASQHDLVDSGQPPAVGVEAIGASMRPMWDAFKLEGEVRMTLVSGEDALTISLLRGTQEAPFNGLAPSGKTFGVFLARAQDLDDQGRPGSVRTYVDHGGMLAQLGAAPRGARNRAPYPTTGKVGPTILATGTELEATNIALIKAAFDRFNNKDWKGLTALYNSDAALYDQVLPADTEGTRAIGKYYAELGKGFPDAREKVEAIWGAGDFVVAETTFTGTNDGPAPGMGIKKATKKAATVRSAHVFRFVGGKVIQHWIFGNGLALPTQLGLIAPPAPPSP